MRTRLYSLWAGWTDQPGHLGAACATAIVKGGYPFPKDAADARRGQWRLEFVMRHDGVDVLVDGRFYHHDPFSRCRVVDPGSSTGRLRTLFSLADIAHVEAVVENTGTTAALSATTAWRLTHRAANGLLSLARKKFLLKILLSFSLMMNRNTK